MSGIQVQNYFNSFSAYLILYHLVLAKNNAGKLFFNFLKFLLFFFGICTPGLSMTGIGVKNSFLSFSACLIPIWIKIIPNRWTLIFGIFLLFFSDFAPPGRVWAEFGSKIPLSLSRPISSYLTPFWIKITPESRFLIFRIFSRFFFGICSPGSSVSGIRV